MNPHLSAWVGIYTGEISTGMCVYVGELVDYRPHGCYPDIQASKFPNVRGGKKQGCNLYTCLGFTGDSDLRGSVGIRYGWIDTCSGSCGRR